MQNCFYPKQYLKSPRILGKNKMHFQNKMLEGRVNKCRESMNINIINFSPHESDMMSTKMLHDIIESHPKYSQRNSSLMSILNHESDSLDTRTEEINKILQRNYENSKTNLTQNCKDEVKENDRRESFVQVNSSYNSVGPLFEKINKLIRTSRCK